MAPGPPPQLQVDATRLVDLRADNKEPPARAHFCCLPLRGRTAVGQKLGTGPGRRGPKHLLATVWSQLGRGLEGLRLGVRPWRRGAARGEASSKGNSRLGNHLNFAFGAEGVGPLLEILELSGRGCSMGRAEQGAPLLPPNY